MKEKKRKKMKRKKQENEKRRLGGEVEGGEEKEEKEETKKIKNRNKLVTHKRSKRNREQNVLSHLKTRKKGPVNSLLDMIFLFFSGIS